MSPTRRSILLGLGAGTLGLFFPRSAAHPLAPGPDPSPTPGEWTDELLAALPRDTGVRSDTSAELRAALGEDYGRLLRGDCRGAVYPVSAEEVRSLVLFARRHRVRFTLRGVGHSQGGHAVADRSVTMRFSAMDGVTGVDPERGTLTAAPGTLWRNVLSASAARGFAPEVLPLFLDLTVGGTLSVGGIGSTSHRFGPLVSTVGSLQVVTGDGTIRTCTPATNADLFHGVLCGLGRIGAITSATIRIRRIAPFVRTFTLLYDDPAVWADDQRRLIADGRATYLEGFCTAAAQGYRTTAAGKRPFAEWFYGLALSVEYADPAARPDATGTLAGLRQYRHTGTEDDTHETFLSRQETAMALARRSGAGLLPHPHLEMLLPAASLPEVLPRVLPMLPLSLGDGHRVLFIRGDRIPPSFTAPAGGDCVLVAVRPVGVQQFLLGEALDALRRVHDVCAGAGGRVYLPGWLGMMDAAAWTAQFRDRLALLSRLERMYDPDAVFHSLLHSSIPET